MRGLKKFAFNSLSVVGSTQISPTALRDLIYMVSIGSAHKHFAYEVYGMKKICEKCGVNEEKRARRDGRLYSNLCVHHKDDNHNNNKEDNLQILCVSCHLSHHKKWDIHKQMLMEKRIKIAEKRGGYSFAEHINTLSNIIKKKAVK